MLLEMQWNTIKLFYSEKKWLLVSEFHSKKCLVKFYVEVLFMTLYDEAKITNFSGIFC